MKCEKCGSIEFSKNGKRKNGEQKYICKECRKKSFSKHKITYTKTEKRLLSFLINFLESDLDDIDIKDFLAKSKEYKPGISDIKIEPCKKNDTYESENFLTAFGLMPRLIICEENNKIKLIKIPAKTSKHFRNSFKLSVR